MTEAQVKAAGAPGGFVIDSGSIYSKGARVALKNGATALQAHRAALARIQSRKKSFFRRSPAIMSDWPGCNGMTEPKEPLGLELEYSSTEMDSIRRGYKPTGMEDKWFLWFADNVLHMHRSWTGTCIYQVQFVAAGIDRFRAVTVVASRDPIIRDLPTEAEDKVWVRNLISNCLFDGWMAPLSDDLP